MLAWVLLLILGCSEKQGGEKSARYPVIDSGYVVADYREPYWLDNDRVIFIGWRPGQPTPQPTHELLDAYVWDTRTNRVSLNMKDAREVCYFQGVFEYGIGPPQRPLKILRGSPGNLQETDATHIIRYGLHARATAPDAIVSVCEMNRFAGLPDPVDRHIKSRLRAGHGYLDLGDNPFGGDYNIRFFPQDQPEGVTLPIRIWEMDGGLPAYIPFMNAYLIYGSRSSAKSAYTEWPKGMPRSIYLLSPDGKVEVLKLPFGEHIRPVGASFHLTKKGVLVVSRDMSALGDINGGAVVYLVQGKQITRVWSRVRGVRNVSADGCQFAATVSTQGENKSPTLRMINLCHDGEER
jgi:hypothetical protein